MGKQLIIENFDKTVLDAFNKLNIGAAKGDFLRYIKLLMNTNIRIIIDTIIIQ